MESKQQSKDSIQATQKAWLTLRFVLLFHWI
jgi:hypothetical protein